MKLVVLLQSFSPFSLQSFHLVNFKFHPFASTFSSPFKSLHCRRTPSVSMDPASVEGKRLSREKTIKNCFVEDDMDNEVDEEEEVGSDVYADDDKKKVSGRRGPGGISPPFCMVEKCGADLTDARRYHKRHKVCELHSKAPVVIVAGLKQRFCQQCSRFHELYEFDETKRSCRRRLAGHNERRRKNTAETTGEGPSRKGTQTKDSQCRQVDEKGRPQIPLQGNSTYKRPEIK